MAKRKTRWNRYTLIVITVVFFILIYFFTPYLSKNNLISPVGSVFKQYGVNTVLDYLLLPLSSGFNRLQNSFTYSINDQSIGNLRNQVVNLKRQLQVKDSLIERLDYLQYENKHLRSLLDYRSNISYSVIPAEIISYQPQNYFYFFWIDAGENKGITVGMPALSFNSRGEQGLVGFVAEVHERSSLVQSILDPQTHVGITIEGYDTKAILKGDKNLKRLLFVDFINNEFTNLEGKQVYTSGIGERYPQGIPIGNITSTAGSLYGLFQSATVKPFIDFTSLKDIFIIISKDSDDSQ